MAIDGLDSSFFREMGDILVSSLHLPVHASIIAVKY